jgi:cell division protein ZapA (FtsZ GTPase activity inhibitor)
MQQVNVLGVKFSVQTDESPERFDKLVEYYSNHAEDLKSRIGTTDPIKTAIIAGIIITDELFKCRENIGPHSPSSTEGEELSTLTDGMIKRIDEVLDL